MLLGVVLLTLFLDSSAIYSGDIFYGNYDYPEKLLLNKEDTRLYRRESEKSSHVKSIDLSLSQNTISNLRKCDIKRQVNEKNLDSKSVARANSSNISEQPHKTEEILTPKQNIKANNHWQHLYKIPKSISIFDHKNTSSDLSGIENIRKKHNFYLDRMSLLNLSPSIMQSFQNNNKNTFTQEAALISEELEKEILPVYKTILDKSTNHVSETLHKVNDVKKSGIRITKDDQIKSTENEHLIDLDTEKDKNENTAVSKSPTSILGLFNSQQIEISSRSSLITNRAKSEYEEKDKTTFEQSRDDNNMANIDTIDRDVIRPLKYLTDSQPYQNEIIADLSENEDENLIHPRNLYRQQNSGGKETFNLFMMKNRNPKYERCSDSNACSDICINKALCRKKDPFQHRKICKEPSRTRRQNVVEKEEWKTNKSAQPLLQESQIKGTDSRNDYNIFANPLTLDDPELEVVYYESNFKNKDSFNLKSNKPIPHWLRAKHNREPAVSV